LSEIIQDEIEIELTLGQKIADKVALFGGSWTFFIFFFSFMLVWIAINSWFMIQKPFDPFPFILLNRQEQKDRQRSEHDYKINLKAELEIKLLSEKIDHLLVHQNRILLEIQEIQTDYLDDLMREIRKNK
jgi:uncharacterized membrane protein